MKTRTKTSGFFIVEILIVLLIVGILALALLPNLQTYVQKARFSDNITAANSLKAAVEMCAMNPAAGTGMVNGTAPAAPFASCSAASNGIPANPTAPYGGYVNTLVTTSGQITATSTAVFGSSGTTAYTYRLTPTTNNGVITWVVDSVSTCIAAGLC